MDVDKDFGKQDKIPDRYDLDSLFDELWPIARSITGPGIEQSLKIISKHVPIEIKEIASGTEVFDWVVPPEWKLNSASLYTEDGEKILSTEDKNIHVLNFSEPYSGLIDYDNLEPHLYSDPSLPEAIPYVTSYYVRRWGLCLSDQQKQSLNKNKKYKVEIDTEIFDGFLRYGDFTLKGKSEKTILLTSYLCHPSLANNELSGPLALVALYKELSKKENYYTYRFIIIPETIGSIAFLATTQKEELNQIFAGIVLTCLGGPLEKVSFKHSRRHWLGMPTEIDSLVESFCKYDNLFFSERAFTPTGGSDERQFCSPGINLPIVQAAKTIYCEHKQYHTSLDNKEFMSINSVSDSIEKLLLFLQCLELNCSPFISEISGGEPMLGKRNLYPTLNSSKTVNISSDSAFDSRDQLNLLLNVISLIDGTRNLQEIVEFLEKPYDEVVHTVEGLIEQGLVRNK